MGINGYPVGIRKKFDASGPFFYGAGFLRWRAVLWIRFCLGRYVFAVAGEEREVQVWKMGGECPMGGFLFSIL